MTRGPQSVKGKSGGMLASTDGHPVKSDPFFGGEDYGEVDVGGVCVCLEVEVMVGVCVGEVWVWVYVNQVGEVCVCE